MFAEVRICGLGQARRKVIDWLVGGREGVGEGRSRLVFCVPSVAVDLKIVEAVDIPRFALLLSISVYLKSFYSSLV
jgi:hypothetical protein